jgi:hypothetical protein
MKFFTLEKIILLVLFIVIVFGIITYNSSKGMFRDNMEIGTTSSPVSIPPMKNPSGSEQPSVKNTSAQNVPGGYAMQPVANPSDLLPHDSNSDWGSLNKDFMNQGNIAMPDLLQAGYHIGLDTIGQSLRNANLQYRSDPIIPKKDIWNGINMSTIEPDLGRIPLEIGTCR